MLLPWMWWHDTRCMLGFMLCHARWMLGWFDMYARCMSGYAMLDECWLIAMIDVWLGMIDATLIVSWILACVWV